MTTSSPASGRTAQPSAAYQLRTEQNAEATARQAAVILAGYQAGRIAQPDVLTYLRTSITVGAARAVSLADAGESAVLASMTGRAYVPTVGLTLPDETAQHIEEQVTEVLDQPEPSPVAVQTLAYSAPLDAGNVAHQDALEAQGVEGWVRLTDSDPCALCQALADGTVVAINKRMIQHPNCSCVPEPVLTGAQPFQRPDDGPDDPADFVPVTLRTGQGIGGRQITRAAPGLTIRRSVFIPAKARTR